MTCANRKRSEREELEAALRRFQASGGEIQESPILSHREEYLRRPMREFDRGREEAIKRAKLAERKAQPIYLPTVRAIKARTR